MFVVIHQNDSAATDRNIYYFLSKINKQLGVPAYCLSDSSCSMIFSLGPQSIGSYRTTRNTSSYKITGTIF